MTCRACGTQLSDSARFCHKCRASVTAPPAATGGRRAGLPWGVAGAALGALVTVLLMRPTGGATAEPPPFAAQGGAPAIDISQMSPEERAQRLFDRVMRLTQEGKQDSAQFFLPMAQQAYAMIPAMDLNARFDVGLLDLAAGEPAGA